MSDGIIAETITITDHNGDAIEAYFARPIDGNAQPSVVVLHHMPGYDRSSKEIVRTFAVYGYATVMPNLHHRYAPGARASDAAAAAREAGGVPDEQCVGDFEGAARMLRARTEGNGRVGVIGYCSGGRQSVLAACHLDVDAAVDCYGAFVTGTPPEGFPIPSNLVDQLPDLRCPLLGLFGNEDKYPTPEHVDELEAILAGHGKTYEIHRYDDAGHAFFAVDRPSYRVAAANDGWERIAAFFARYLNES
ncbi:MAG TPA: dienelactone hydrolase family protein [Nocardioides sp.]|nr:dienelactone hydrolase family protein [Nocardioides sp.]